MIDTLKASHQLKENGFDDNQAQSIIEVILSNNEQIATKIDIEHLKIDIENVKLDIENVKQDMQDMKQDIQGLKQDIRGLNQDIRGIKQDMRSMRQGTQRDSQSLRWLVGISLLLNTLAISGIIALLMSNANL